VTERAEGKDDAAFINGCRRDAGRLPAIGRTARASSARFIPMGKSCNGLPMDPYGGGAAGMGGGIREL
tara:strand:+ start:577 stop:780 length:204 start_codon:yes stop_codon:yes gene_type:complete